MRMITLAAVDYLARHGIPETLDDLRVHQRISYVYQGEMVGWGFDVGGHPVTIDGAGAFRTNDAESVRSAVLAGLGVAHHASWLFTDALAAGEVKQVLGEYVPAPFPINAITAAGRRMPSRVRHFIDFLGEICAGEPELQLRTS